MRPKASIPFLNNQQEFLWFCLTCRETGIPPSKRLGIKDRVAALDLDNAYLLRLMYYDKEQKDAERKMLAYEVCKMAFGSEETPVDNTSVEVW